MILEARSREYVEQRIRCRRARAGDGRPARRDRGGGQASARGLVHEGIELQFAGERHRIDFPSLTGGRTITVYGQQEVVKDLIAARVETGRPLLFEVDDVTLAGVESKSPAIRFVHGRPARAALRLRRGLRRLPRRLPRRDPGGVLTEFARDYPFAWLGILAEAAPSNDELILTTSAGSRLATRSPTRTRLYLQCRPDEDLDEWSDERMEELDRRLDLPGWTLNQGPVIEKGVTGMRSFVVDDAVRAPVPRRRRGAHLPPTGAKGLNLAVADVRVFADGLAAWYGRETGAGWSATRPTCCGASGAPSTSWWMTSMLHRLESGDEFDRQAPAGAARLRHLVAARRGVARGELRRPRACLGARRRSSAPP